MFEIALVTTVVLCLSELIKKSQLNINIKFIPFIDLAIGIIASFLFPVVQGWRESLLQGIILGLSASGLYSGMKNVRQGLKGENDL